MADKVIYMDENGKPESKFKAAWRDAKFKAKCFYETCKQNKEQVVAVAAIVVPGAIEITKMLIRNGDKRADEDHRKREMWDPVEGHWWKLRRELKTSEYLEVERRVRDGESRGEVLEDMGLLRR